MVRLPARLQFGDHHDEWLTCIAASLYRQQRAYNIRMESMGQMLVNNAGVLETTFNNKFSQDCAFRVILN